MLRARTRMRRRVCEIGFRRTACVYSVGRPQTGVCVAGCCWFEERGEKGERGKDRTMGKGRKKKKMEKKMNSSPSDSPLVRTASGRLLNERKLAPSGTGTAK